MKKIKIWNDDPSERQVQETAAFLDAGELMIWPTDTLYGIACDALNKKAVERLCRLKGINPEKTNLSIVCSSISQAAEYCRIGNRSFELMKRVCPGPYTFLLPASSTLPKAFKGRKTVGVRIPACRTDIAIVEALGRPVLTTSVEFEEDDFAINPELIAETYEGRIDLLIDAGDGDVEPSTVIDCSDDEPEIMRQGKGDPDIL